MRKHLGYRLGHIFPGYDQTLTFDTPAEAAQALTRVRQNIYNTRKNYPDRRFQAEQQDLTVRISCEYLATHGSPDRLGVGEYLDYDKSVIAILNDPAFAEVQLPNGQYRIMRVY